MNVIVWLRRAEAVLSSCGFVVMMCALFAGFGRRMFFGEPLVGSSEIALTGFLTMALFGVGLAADVGQHLRPRTRALVPERFRDTLTAVRYFITSVFFLGLFSLAVYTCVESRVLDDVTAISGWPLWMVQGVMVVSFALNSLRFLLYAFDTQLRPVLQPEPWLRQQDIT